MAKDKRQKQSSPMSLRPDPELRQKIERIAESNKLSITDVAHLALSAGLNMVEMKLKEIHAPQKQAA